MAATRVGQAGDVGEANLASRGTSWYHHPSHAKKNVQKFRIKRTNKCDRSVEITQNCDVNPDQPRCNDGSFSYIETIIFDGGSRDGEFLSQRLRCPEDTDVEISNVLLIKEVTVTPEQFRNFPIQPSALNSDPQQFSLRNGNTHFWANATTQSFNTTINGTAVEIKAIPVQWLWDYGDGTNRTLNFPGELDPTHTLHDETPTSHSYKETGIFNVNLTTLYRGEFRIVGEDWQPIPGQAAVPSESIPIDVWRTRKELVATDGQ